MPELPAEIVPVLTMPPEKLVTWTWPNVVKPPT
jgi:hypothetical protein